MTTRSVWYRYQPSTSGTALFSVTQGWRHHVNVFADKNGTLAGVKLVSTYGRASVTAGTAYAVQVVTAARPWTYYAGDTSLDATITTSWLLGGTGMCRWCFA